MIPDEASQKFRLLNLNPLRNHFVRDIAELEKLCNTVAIQTDQ